jgi:1,2-diacylglycerol 3-alpha-glucosyltransferase
MRRRLHILTEIIAPYRIPIFNALAERDEIELHVLFLSETDASLRQWRVNRQQIRFSHEVMKSIRRRLCGFNVLITRGIGAALERSRPDVILAGGYSYLAMWQAQRWARRHAIPFLLWSESNAQDSRKNLWWVESAKRRFISSCQGFVVPGTTATEYLASFGVSRSQIFVAPNAVDVEQFTQGAAEARHDPRRRERLGLPERYFLYVGRFVRPKGVFDLLSAYAKLPQEVRKSVGLVFVGDGVERGELLRCSRDVQVGRIRFAGFVQQEELPAFYALADALVLPTHSDTWGLVVNEAMACGLPLIATDMAGCGADLVSDGINGYVVRAGEPELLAQAMLKLISDPPLRDRMGLASARMTESFTPQIWAEGVVRAVTDRMGADS